MDTELLVENQIDDGQLLIEQLIKDGFDVSVALWVKTSEEGLWYLIIASPEVAEQSLSDAYQTLYSSLDKLSASSISYSDVKLMTDSNAVSRAAIELRDRLPARIPTRIRDRRLGTLTAREGYIYQKIMVPLRQSFLVSYVRQGDSNKWLATTQRKEFYRGLKSTGVASYSTALWHGDKPEDQKFALIYVLVEVDSELDEKTLLANSNLLVALAEQARTLADAMFRQKYPDAEIENGGLMLATENVSSEG
jgi:hypothetical protein